MPKKKALIVFKMAFLVTLVVLGCGLLFATRETTATLSDSEGAPMGFNIGDLKFAIVAPATSMQPMMLASVAETATDGDVNATTTATTTPAIIPAEDSVPDFTPLKANQPGTRSFQLADSGSVGFQYTVQLPYTVGTLCNYLNLKAELNGNVFYDGPLNTEKFFVRDAGKPTGMSDDWNLTATLNQNDVLLQGQTCYFDLAFNALQAGGKGFSSSKVIGNSITWDEPLPEPADPGVKTGENAGNGQGNDGNSAPLSDPAKLQLPPDGLNQATGTSSPVTVSTDELDENTQP